VEVASGWKGLSDARKRCVQCLLTCDRVREPVALCRQRCEGGVDHHQLRHARRAGMKVSQKWCRGGAGQSGCCWGEEGGEVGGRFRLTVWQMPDVYSWPASVKRLSQGVVPGQKMQRRADALAP
jgi:hypothetical protein